MRRTALIGLLLASLALGLVAAGCGGSGSSGRANGTMKASFSAFPDYMDPALSHTAEGWTALWNTYLPLLSYAHEGGKAGSEVIPALAEAMPEISNGGKTYTLTLRKGLKYSDGTPVKASDFPYTVERLFRLNSSGTYYYEGIVGAEAFAKTKQGGIPGIEADDKTGKITIDLVAPSGTFANELALPFVALVPAGTPNQDLTNDPPPATGPYEIVRSAPGKGWDYARNPQWAKANGALIPDVPDGHMDRIEVTVIRNPSTQVDDIEQGTYDWMGNPPPADRYAAVKDKFDGSQFRVEPTESTYFFWMNTKEAPFDDPQVRQAVNYALNSEALERIYAGQLAAGQQVLPPGMPGYEELDLYPYDLAKAKELIREADPADKQITVWTDTESPNNEAGEYLDGVLDEIGFETTLKIINADNYFTVIGNETTPDLDIGWASWFQDYPHPNTFFEPMFSEAAIYPTNSTNLARFADPEVSAKIDQLAEKPLDPEIEAGYADLDREVMEAAPWAPYGSATVPTFVSSDIDLDAVVFNPTFSQDLTSFQFK
ncbi:MAG TPA: ABC transporter substrate-binding protein [Solirubrobacterales bacterium]|jgi:peptide/nickel transport system substrate-binding protein|nr:ABC transporter substrate-binding protein [Solirubrobacterales bacterium]